jgi:hypothetical protein
MLLLPFEIIQTSGWAVFEKPDTWKGFEIGNGFGAILSEKTLLAGCDRPVFGVFSCFSFWPENNQFLHLLTGSQAVRRTKNYVH